MNGQSHETKCHFLMYVRCFGIVFSLIIVSVQQDVIFMHPELQRLPFSPSSHLFALTRLLFLFSLYLCLTPYVWFASTLKRHTLSVVLSSADSLVLVLTDSVGEKSAGWVLQARYIIRLQRCLNLRILL